MRWTTDRVAGAALALFALGVVWESLKLPLGTFREPGPGYMPLLLALLLLGFGVLVVAGSGTGARLATLGWGEWRHALAILGSCLFAALALERLGFRLTVLLILLFLLKVVERRSWLISAAVALVIAFGTFFLFNTVLRVLLPRGPFGF